MLLGNDRKILKRILENHLIIDHKNLTVLSISEKTDLSQEEVFKSIQKLLTFQYIRITDYLSHWTVKELTITEKGINALEFDFRSLIRDIFIGVAVFISIIAILIKIEIK